MSWLLGGLLACVGAVRDTGPLSDEVCAQRSPEACDADGRCSTLWARELSEDDQGGLCVDYALDTHLVGCLGGDLGCGAALTYGRLPGGDCMEFPSTCQPDGWEACPGVETVEECAF